ncbi:partial Cyclic di-GMP phosphodiesterase PdeB, partial [Gallionellaceae bacterium]
MVVPQPAGKTNSASETASRSYFIMLPWLVLAVSLAFTYQLWHYKQQDATRDLQTLFDFRLREISNHIEHRMKAYEQTLHGVRILFAADPNVSRSEFRSYVNTLQIQKNYPGIQHVRFSPVVIQAAKAQHVAAVRAEGFPEYAITPGGERDIYAPVQYIEPFSGISLHAFGHDSYYGERRQTAMDQARDTDEVTNSGKLALAIETGQDRQAGFLMYLPVYKYGMPHNTPDERRANISGWVGFTFRSQDLINSILGESNPELDIEIFDGEKAVEEEIIFDSDDGKRKTMPEPDASLFKNARHIKVAGHTWTVQGHSLPSFDARLYNERQRFIAIAGTGVSLLLALLAWLLVHGRALALQSARDMNRELIESREALNLALSEMKAVTEANPDMLYVVNTRGELIRWSPSLEKFLGLAPEQMMNKPATEFVYAEDQPAAAKWMQEIFETGYSSIEARMLSKDGVLVSFLCNGAVLKNPSGEIIGLTGTGRDITEHKQAQNLERIRNQVLELLANDAPLADILAKIALWVEAEDSRSKCSIVLLDDESRRLSIGAAPNLPDFYKATLEGVLEQKDCSCSVSAYRGERVVYENILAQCRTAISCALAARGWVASCWSEPIKSPLGIVQGVLTLYRKDAISPGGREIKLIEHAASLVSMSLANKQLKKDLHLASLVLQTSSEGMLVTDADNRIIAVNPAFSAITGYSFADVKGRNPKIFSSGRHDAAFFKAMWHEISTTGHWQGEIWDRRKSGEIHANWLTINTIRNEQGQVQRYVALFSDITEKKLSEELIWKQANFDALTELPNRRMFLDRLEQEAKKSDRAGLPLALLLIDLDQFKEVNDTLGHDMGDILLQQAARRIHGCVRESD